MASIKPRINKKSAGKAEVLSLSLKPEERRELDAMHEKLGFKNRSKLLRAGLESLLNEYRLVEKLEGTHKVIFVVAHEEEHEAALGNIIHEFEDAVNTTIHQKSERLCVEIITAEGPASRLKPLFSTLKKAKGVRQVQAFVL